MIQGKKLRIAILAAGLAVVLLTALVVGIVVGRKNTVSQAAGRNAYERAILGKWAYLHDKDTAAASFQANGKAKFEGKKYDFSCDGERIYLTDKSGETLALRYAWNGDQLILYIKSRYVLEDGSSPKGLEGVWICKETNWMFEFTSKGTFMEDGVLTGHYFPDEENGMLTLVYERALEDTVFYYQLTEEGLWVEYPWPTERMR